MKTFIQTSGPSRSIRHALNINLSAWARAAAKRLVPKANFALALLACAGSISGLAPARLMAADATTNNELEEVTVTGIRASIQSAIEVKRESSDIVEVVSAEDIGKLPDPSIAESLTRLPGITAQRSDGRTSDISIRGFGPDFNGTLMNGREQVSTGDNRAIQFDQYPAELIHSVEVYKTPDASLIGQGLAGTIDLQTTRPLEYGKRALVFDVRGIKNGNGDLGADSTDKQYRASISYVDQYMDNTLGLTVGFARLDTPTVTKEVGLYDPWHQNGTEHAGVPADAWVTDGIKSLASTGLDKRDGAVATLEWRPNPGYTSTLDAYYTNRTWQDQRRSIEANLGNYPDTTNYSNLVIGGDNSLIGATVANLVPLARNFLYITKDDIFATGWNNKWTPGDWTLSSDFGYSRATRDEHDYETQGTYQGGVTDTGTFYIPSSSSPGFALNNNYADPTKILVGPTIYGAGYSRFPHVVDELKSARLDASHALSGWFSAVQGGLNFDDRTKNKTQPEANLNANANCPCQIASQYLLPPTNLSFSGTPSALAWNVPAVLANYFQPIVPSTTASYLVGKTWEVSEKLSTAYIMAKLDHDLSATVNLRGNVGVQVVHTQQSSDSNAYITSAVPIHDGTNYNDVLPSANLVFGFPDSQKLRVGLARELVRARMDQLDVSYDYSFSTAAPFIPSATGGNARLAPWRADAVDLSYEKYFENNAIVSVAGFYKKLTTYIYDITSPYDFSAQNAAASPNFSCVNPPVPGSCPEQAIGMFTRPENGSGGRVDGIELAFSVPGELFWDALRGFGASGSVSQTASSISIPGQVSGLPSQNITLPGLSKTVWQATVYYERAGFSARLATTYRSNYIGEITDFAGDRALEYVRHEQISAFQAGYDVQGGPMRGFGVVFQIDNLTNTPFIDYAGVSSRVRDYETYGRVYFFGAKYKL
ncbi:MAG TPA: TonB-dependent receptor [Steroidobacteraceae bacterium]|nr:TonB-dependent receptor [Steroidobacteraceae bacterium]